MIKKCAILLWMFIFILLISCTTSQADPGRKSTVNETKDALQSSGSNDVLEHTPEPSPNLEQGRLEEPILIHTDTNEIKGILKDMKTMNSWTIDKPTTWRVIYSNPNKVIFYSYSNLIVCNISSGKPEIYRIVDLKKSQLGEFSEGSPCMDFICSPDGNYCIMGSDAFGGEDVNAPDRVGPAIHLVDFANNRQKVIGNEDMAFLQESSGWSNSSKYFAFADIKKQNIIVCNNSDFTMVTISYKDKIQGDIKKLYVSDDGKVVAKADTGKFYFDPRDNKAVKLDLSGEILRFDDCIHYFKDGTIYENNLKEDRKVLQIGSDYQYEPGVPYGYENLDFAIFSDGKTKQVYDFRKKTVQGYPDDKAIEKLLGFDHGFKVVMKKDQSKLGDFDIVEYDSTAKETVVYSN